MPGSLGSLNVELSAETVRFNRAMDKAAFKAHNSFNKIMSGARRMAPVLTAALAPGLIGLQFKKIIDDADELSKMSRKIGVSVQSLSAWRHGAKLAGTEFAVLTKGTARFSRVMSDASAGLLTARRPLEQLNVEFTNADGTLRNVEEALLDVADRFALMEDGAKKAALAQELFGRAGVELIPFLNEGSAGIAEMRKEAERLGIVFDTKTAVQAEQFNDNMTRLKATLTGVFIHISSQLLPVMQNYTDQMVENAASSRVLRGDTDDLSTSQSSLAEALINSIGVMEGMGIAWTVTTKSMALGFRTIKNAATLNFKEIKQDYEDTATKLDEIQFEFIKKSEQRWENFLNPEPLRQRLKKQRDNLEAVAVEREKLNKIEAEAARITKSVLTPSEKLVETQEKLQMMIEQGAISQETYNRAAEKAIALYDKQTTSAANVNTIMQDLGATFSSQFEDAIVQGKKFLDLLDAIGNDIIRIFVRRKITEPLFGALFGGTSGTGGLFSGLFSAKGNVFSGGNLSMFGHGGVINSPIMFPMAGRRAGIAGEKGVEGILPLTRTSGGDLGVKAEMGGRTEVNVYAPPGSQVSEERQTEGGLERINVFIDDATADNIRPGTKTYKALRDNFGIGQTLIRR